MCSPTCNTRKGTVKLNNKRRLDISSRDLGINPLEFQYTETRCGNKPRTLLLHEIHQFWLQGPRQAPAPSFPGKMAPLESGRLNLKQVNDEGSVRVRVRVSVES